jgi:hypothetical protein
MAQTMIAFTNVQIAVAKNQLDDAMRKHRDEIPKDVMQQVLGVPNLGMRLYAVIRSLAEDISKQIVHVVEVNRSRFSHEAIKASGRRPYVNSAVVAAIPHGSGDKVKLVYFKPDESAYKNGYLSCVALDAEYMKRGLAPDPRAQIDDNAANPEFADKTPNACQWKDKDGNWCYATFHRWHDERLVDVNRLARAWDDPWSFAGVPQGSVSSDT